MASLSFSLSLEAAHRALLLPAVIAEGYICTLPPDLACVFDNRVIPLNSGRRSASGLFLEFFRVVCLSLYGTLATNPGLF